MRNEKNLEDKEYKERNLRKLEKLETRGNNLHLPRCKRFRRWGILRFPHRFRAKKEKVQEELQKEIEGGEYTISTYGVDTEEWRDANAKLEEKKHELSRKVELSFRFEELGEIGQFQRR